MIVVTMTGGLVGLNNGGMLHSWEYYFKIGNLFDERYYSGAYLPAPGRYIESGMTLKF